MTLHGTQKPDLEWKPLPENVYIVVLVDIAIMSV
jgi:hypothetical protein